MLPGAVGRKRSRSLKFPKGERPQAILRLGLTGNWKERYQHRNQEPLDTVKANHKDGDASAIPPLASKGYLAQLDESCVDL
jgi:hypothetical protein